MNLLTVIYILSKFFIQFDPNNSHKPLLLWIMVSEMLNDSTCKLVVIKEVK